ncbi:T9SS type A sorting domain-containing protein [Hymenobacter sp. UYP22]|uniref:T9SS type A sorting domain-containing protein n=1 Tax=Hymenobacter sp. UYP22 TaxID=3156348 RepID=UPI003392E2A8
MKKTYLSSVPLASRTWLWVLMVITFLLVPFASRAQTAVYSEDMSDAGISTVSRETITSYATKGGFTYDQAGSETGAASYSGTARLATSASSSGYTGASGGASIFFGPATSASDPGTPPYDFTISGLNTSQVSNLGVTFGLYTPNGAIPSSADFTVQYTTNGSTYTTATYARTTSNTSATGYAWNLYTVSFASQPAPSTSFGLRFTRTGTATTQLYRLDDAVIRGTVSTTPTITANPTTLVFGTNTVVGSTSAEQTFVASGQSLTAPLLLTASSDYLISTTTGGPYVSSLSLTPTAGTVPNTTIYVVFQPTVSGSNNGSVTLTSTGANTVAVNTFGTAQPAPAILNTNPTTIIFPTTQVGQASTPSTFTVTGSNLTSSNVTVTAPSGFQVRLPNGAYSSTLTLAVANGSVNQTIETRFVPTVAQDYASEITITAGATSTTVEVSGTATPAPTGPFIVVNPSSLDFGTVSATGSAQTLTFSINAGNLTDPLVLTGSTNNIVFRDASAGGSFTNGPLVIAPSGGTVSIRNIEVQLTGPIARGPFTGSITASSTGATNQVVTIIANSTGNNSVINASGNLNQFSTVPGVPSAAQSYTLSGSNLLQDITVAAPQYFQVSTDPNFAGVTGTGNTIVVARNSGSDVTATTIYVRFIPPSALNTSSLILNSSSPAIAQGIPVAGTSEPNIQIANAFQEVRNVMLNTRSASQALTINAERVLQPVTISKLLSTNPLNPENTPQFELSLDNVTFTNSVVLTPSSTTYTINQPIYVRYRPTYLGTAQSTLQFQSNDFANKSVQSFGANDLLSGRSIDTEPTLRSTATVTRSGTTATVTFNLPANYAQLGYGEGRLIVASTNPELPAANQPIDGNSYQTGNQTYGQGPQIAPGFFAVYSGANQTVVVDGLDLATTYYFYTFEYNNIDNNFNVSVIGAENYLSPPVPNTIPGIIAPSPLPVTLVSFSAKVKNNQVALNWETAAELNNKHFEVQRSRDGRSFETVLIREGKGTTSSRTVYNEVDKKPLNGVSYYRLKQVDLDGSSSFSSLVAVSFLNSGDVTMYPNPVEDQLTIELGGSAEGVTAIITDMTGRVISTQKLGADSKLNMSTLQTGTYLVTVGEGTAKVTRRIVKK